MTPLDIGEIVLTILGFTIIIAGILYSREDYNKVPPVDGSFLGMILALFPWYVMKIFFIFVGCFFS
jgi:hypothetical protein